MDALYWMALVSASSLGTFLALGVGVLVAKRLLPGVVDHKIQLVLDDLGKNFSRSLEEAFSPIVKRSMSHLQKMSVDQRNLNAVQKEGIKALAMQKLGPLAAVAKIAGFDIDAIIEEHGEGVLQAIDQFLPILQNIKLPGGLGGVGSANSTERDKKNPFDKILG